jgi:predicted cupin superfamily sugar epimerase
MSQPTAADIIAALELKPHPEGGHYRETFRDIRTDANGRSLSTCWRATNVRIGIASTPSKYGTITPAAR